MGGNRQVSTGKRLEAVAKVAEVVVVVCHGFAPPLVTTFLVLCLGPRRCRRYVFITVEEEEEEDKKNGAIWYLVGFHPLFSPDNSPPVQDRV